ncbi:MAG: hypothetical protein ACU0B1_10540 [Thermohalobaculum sp.]
MSVGAFSIGRDCQLVVTGSSGRLDLSFVTGFECRQLTHSIRLDRLDGVPMGAELPRGWEGSFELERGNSAVDDFIAQLESGFYSGGSMPTGTVYQYVTETDGSMSTYQFSGVVFRLGSAGAWRGDNSVKQKLEFFATKRQRV